MIAILNLVDGAILTGVLMPFLLCGYVRNLYVRGTRPRAVLNAVVVNLRPVVRPATVLHASFSIIIHALTNDGAWRSVSLLLDIVVLYVWWNAADDWRDQDDDDPWPGRKSKARAFLRRLQPTGRLTPVAAGSRG